MTGPAALPATPLRAVGVGLALLAVGSTALSLSGLLVLQEARTSSSFEGVRTVEVLSTTGDVQVVADARGATQVEARETWSFARVRHSEQVVGGVLRLASSCPDWYGQCSLSYVVHVPAGTGARVRSSADDVLVIGAGDVDVSASSGDVEVESTTGDLDLRAGSGNVLVTGARASRVHVSAGSGDLDLSLSSAPDALDVSTGSGDTTVRLPDDGRGFRVSTRTGSGDERVDVRRDQQSSRTLTARTGSGDLDVRQTGR